jgi:glutamate transport system permease protein
MKGESVLYDAPGPRARRVTLIASLGAAVLAVVGAYFLIYRPLKRTGSCRWSCGGR